MSIYEGLAIGGISLQLVGFFLVVVAAERALTGYGYPGLPVRTLRRIEREVRRAFRYVFEGEPQPQQASGSIHATGGASGTLTGHRVEMDPIDRLTREVKELTEKFDKYREQADQRFAGVEGKITAQGELLEERATAIADRVREIHVATLRKEKTGAAVFLVGTTLTLFSVALS